MSNTTLVMEEDQIMVCESDFYSMGYQPGEKAVTLVRVLCTLISVSIISSWCNKNIVARYLLFFTHYLAGLVHQLSEMVLAEMVLLCWARSSALRYIQALKFLELMGGNLLAITNVAICVNLALVVSSHHTMARVRSITSPRLILGFMVISFAAALAGALYWDTVYVSGTLFWSVNVDPAKHNWVLTSIFFVELLAGAVMLVIGTLLVLFRWPELCQVWRLHRRIKCYIILSVVATVVDLAIGVGGVVYVLYEEYKPALITATWTMRHVHIALDTLVLYSALGVTTRPGSAGDPTAKNSDPSGVQSGSSPYHSGSFHQNHRHLHAPAHGGPKPSLCVTSSGRRWGGAMTSAISPEYGPEEAI